MKYKSYAVKAETYEEALELVIAQRLMDIPEALGNSISAEAGAYYRFSPFEKTFVRAGYKTTPYAGDNIIPVEANLTFKEWKQMTKENSGQKLTGYRLKKDTPLTKAGTIFTRCVSGWGAITSPELFQDKTLDNEEWFEAIYEEKSVIIRCKPSISGTEFSFKVTKAKMVATVAEGDLEVDPVVLKNLINRMEAPHFFYKHDVQFSAVDVGCKKGIQLQTLKEVYKAYKELNQ